MPHAERRRRGVPTCRARTAPSRHRYRIPPAILLAVAPEFEPGNITTVEVRNENGISVLRVTLTESLAKALAECLQPNVGVYGVPEFPRFEIVVKRAEIKDAEGCLVEVIGRRNRGVFSSGGSDLLIATRSWRAELPVERASVPRIHPLRRAAFRKSSINASACGLGFF